LEPAFLHMFSWINCRYFSFSSKLKDLKRAEIKETFAVKFPA
jgi:hypothetical protein